jgi:acyl-CoA synthetase (AMP-forming)/AMP-acid ligase II
VKKNQHQKICHHTAQPPHPEKDNHPSLSHRLVELLSGCNPLTKHARAAVQEKRISPYYFFERHVEQQPDAECLWWRGTGGDDAAGAPSSFTRAEAYHRTSQYAQFFGVHGVRPGDLVGLFMENSPDFVFAWMGLLAVGAAPALINHNLSHAALLHCLGISGATLVLASGRPDMLARIDQVRDDLSKRGVTVLKLEEGAAAEVNSMTAERPADSLREGVTPGSPFGLFYTRFTCLPNLG